jgi:hypothetical protein
VAVAVEVAPEEYTMICVPSDQQVQQQEEKKQPGIRTKKIKTSTRCSTSDEKVVDDTSEIIPTTTSTIIQ